jgi:hypothetical protein
LPFRNQIHPFSPSFNVPIIGYYRLQPAVGIRLVSIHSGRVGGIFLRNVSSAQPLRILESGCWAERIAITGGNEMAEGESTGSSVVWAIALVIIVAIIAGAFYYSGGFKGGSDKKWIDIEIKAPTR